MIAGFDKNWRSFLILFFRNIFQGAGKLSGDLKVPEAKCSHWATAVMFGWDWAIFSLDSHSLLHQIATFKHKSSLK